MKITLIPTDKSSDGFVFPVLPEEIQANADTHYQSYTVISKGNVLVPKGLETNEFTWTGYFFGEQQKNLPFVDRDAWQNPIACVDTLRKWMNDNATLNLVISDTWINQDVTIATFNPVAYGGMGNVRYEITLKVYKNLEIYTKGELEGDDSGNGTGTGEKITVTGRTPHLDYSGKPYTIKEGDTLWTIAIYVYGDGSLWSDIWKKNKKILNKAAKKAGYKNADNGYRLIAGTEITIP